MCETTCSVAEYFSLGVLFEVVCLFFNQVQSKGLHVLLSPKSEGFVPLLRVSKSAEVCELVCV